MWSGARSHVYGTLRGQILEDDIHQRILDICEDEAEDTLLLRGGVVKGKEHGMTENPLPSVAPRAKRSLVSGERNSAISVVVVLSCRAYCAVVEVSGGFFISTQRERGSS